MRLQFPFLKGLFSYKNMIISKDSKMESWKLRLFLWVCITSELCHSATAVAVAGSCSNLANAQKLFSTYDKIKDDNIGNPVYQNSSRLKYPCGMENSCTCYQLNIVFNLEKTLNVSLQGMFVRDYAKGFNKTVTISEVCTVCTEASADNSLVSWPQDMNYLTLRGSSFTAVTENLVLDLSSDLLVLYVQGTRLSSLSQTSFQISSLRNLSALIVSNNKITNVEPSLFSSLTKLWYMDLSFNYLTQFVAQHFEGLISLRVLLLNNNQLTHPPHFPPLVPLVDLDLSNNLGLNKPDMLFGFVNNFYSINRTFPYDASHGLQETIRYDLGTLLKNRGNDARFFYVVRQVLLEAFTTNLLNQSNSSNPMDDCVYSIIRTGCLPTGWAFQHLDKIVCDLVDAFVKHDDPAHNQSHDCDEYLDDVVAPVFLTEMVSTMANVIEVYRSKILDDVVQSIGEEYNALRLILTGLPVECDIGKFGIFESDLGCYCSRLYESNGEGECVSPSRGYSFKVVLIAVFSGLIFGVLLVLIIFITLRSFRKLKDKVDLTELLLKENEMELLEYKESWMIKTEEIHLIEAVDEGSYGVVWKASWDELIVAVKRIKRSLLELNDEAREEFEKEVAFICKCRHRNIVRFFGANVDSEVPFLVTEFMTGGCLRDYLRANSIQWKKKLQLIMDIHAGMHHIHTLGRIHRDLKTDNILLTKQLRAKIADFGSMKNILSRRDKNKSFKSSSISTPVHLGKTMTGQVGTPNYMAPELLDGKTRYGPPADVWSFAVVMWEICNQVEPELISFFPEEETSAFNLRHLAKILREGKRLPLDNMKDCPHELKTLITQCWDLVPMNRPSIDDLGDSLSQLYQE
eukprot:m.341215 g.341215  ORF g.341215 m.341215 type:complete len:855 (+) comp19916_c0_seq1:198-2762(+)